MKEVGLTLLKIALLSFIVFLSIGLLFIGNKETIAPSPEIKCEHEFVTTSEFNWIIKAYKTYSICTKCGTKY